LFTKRQFRDNQKFKLSKQKPKFKGLLTTGKINEQKVFAIKPLTFMNSSGVCIKELIEYFKIDVKDVFVFHDDMDIDTGNVISVIEFPVNYNNHKDLDVNIQTVRDEITPLFSKLALQTLSILEK